MTGKEMIEILKNYQDYEVEFVINDTKEGDRFLNIRTFKDIRVADIGHSSKAISFDGEEDS